MSRRRVKLSGPGAVGNPGRLPRDLRDWRVCRDESRSDRLFQLDDQLTLGLRVDRKGVDRGVDGQQPNRVELGIGTEFGAVRSRLLDRLAARSGPVHASHGNSWLNLGVPLLGRRLIPREDDLHTTAFSAYMSINTFELTPSMR